MRWSGTPAIHAPGEAGIGPARLRHRAGSGAPGVRRSDNTAGNQLFETLGGPAGFDADLAALGDDVTQADRTE